MLEELKVIVCAANLELVRQGLVTLQHRVILKQGRESHIGPGGGQQTQ